MSGFETPDSERVALALEAVRPKMRRLLATFHLSEEDAEDLTQEALLLALLRSRAIEDMEGWLLGTLKNLCLMFKRARSRRGAVPLERTPEPARGSPEASWIFRLDLNQALGCLPLRYRTLLRLRLAGFRPDEIASRLGYQVASLRQLVGRSHDRIALHLSRRAAWAAWKRSTPARRPPLSRSARGLRRRGDSR